MKIGATGISAEFGKEAVINAQCEKESEQKLKLKKGVSGAKKTVLLIKWPIVKKTFSVCDQ